MSEGFGADTVLHSGGNVRRTPRMGKGRQNKKVAGGKLGSLADRAHRSRMAGAREEGGYSSSSTVFYTSITFSNLNTNIIFVLREERGEMWKRKSDWRPEE